MKTEFTPSQKRALAIVTGIALLFGAYFLRRYFMLIVMAAVVAYLFTPLYNRLRDKTNGGLATTLTVLRRLPPSSSRSLQWSRWRRFRFHAC